MRILKKNPPDYIIVHLITSLPLILLSIFNFKTKFILRISGLPRLNIFRKLLWKLALKKVYIITCPTQQTSEFIKSLKLCDENKLKVLFDPIIDVSEINKNKKEKIDTNDNFYIAIGRLTKQKFFISL